MRYSSNMELFFLRTLKELKKKGISQKDLAKRCGLSQATISGVVRGKPCKIETFELLLDGLYKAKGWIKEEDIIVDWGAGTSYYFPQADQPSLLEAQDNEAKKQLQEDISKTILDKKTIAERFLRFITLGVCG